MRRLALGLAFVVLPSVAQAGLPASVAPTALASATRDGAPITIPSRADAPFRVAAGNESIAASIALRGSLGVDGVEGCGDTRYAGALAWPGAHADVLLRPTDGGVESVVSLSGPPPSEALTYDVALRGASGLRVIENVLELLDAHGTPQLRLRAPEVVDARGEHHTTSLDVQGCDFDASPIAPWGRPVVAPGASVCEVIVRWIGGVDDYPLTVSTAWVDGGTLVFPRAAHAATTLPDGRALLAGGYGLGSSESYTRAAELFDPATGTWATTASMRRARAHHAAVLLSRGVLGGRPLFVGGDDDLEPTAEIYDPARARWTETSPMNVARDGVEIALLPGGLVLAAGGCSDYGSTCTRVEASAELFDPTTNAWTPTANAMSVGRTSFTMTRLDDGTVIAAGGCTAFSEGVECAAATARVDRYDPRTGSWRPTGALETAAHAHVATALPNGDVLLAGGATETGPLRGAQTYDPATEAWVSAGDLAHDRLRSSATLLEDGRVLVTGSLDAAQRGTVAATSELFDPRAGTWVAGPKMVHSHGEHTSTLLEDGSVLIAGGFTAGAAPGVRVSAVGEVYAPSRPRGATTALGSEALETEALDDDSLETEALDAYALDRAMVQGCDIAGSPRRGTAALALAALALALLARRRVVLPRGSRARLIERRVT